MTLRDKMAVATRAALTGALALLALFIGGCSTRETAKSTVMAAQAVEGGELILAGPELAAAVNDPRMPEDLRVVIRAQVGAACELFAQARENIAPAVNLLSDGKPVETGTSAAEAARDPRAFQRLAGRQVGRAEAEVQGLLWWRAVGGAVLSLGKGISGSLLSQTLLGLGGAGGLGAAGLIIARVLAIKNKVTAAMADYASDAAAADPSKPEELEAVKTKHQKRQIAAGIHGAVAAVIKSSKQRGKA